MERVPGNKLPGYDHSVPPGQRRSAPNRPIAVSPIRRFASQQLLGREGQAYGGCAALVHGADSYVVHLV
jgi:hypothetical protein